MRAQEFTRASLARQPLEAKSSRVQAGIHEVRAAPSWYAPPIASQVTCARVGSPATRPRCPALSRCALSKAPLPPLPPAHRRPLCGASGAGYDRFFSWDQVHFNGQRSPRRRATSLWATRPASCASASRRSRLRLAARRGTGQGVGCWLSIRQRMQHCFARTRILSPLWCAGATLSAGHVCAAPSASRHAPFLPQSLACAYMSRAVRVACAGTERLSARDEERS